MKPINRNELQYLLDHGVKLGEYIHLSHSNRHKYYVVENPKVLELLEKSKVRQDKNIVVD